MLQGTLQATLPVFRPDMHDPELPVNRVYGGVYDPRPAVNCLAWSPDSSLLATGDMKGTVTVWNVVSGAVTVSLRDDGGDPGEDGSPPRAISAVAWSPDGLKLCTTSRRGGASVWELATGKVEHVPEGSERFFWVGVAWSPDGACVATGEKGAGIVRVWDAATGDCVRVMENLADCISSVAWSPLGDMLACASLTSVRVREVPDAFNTTSLARGPWGLFCLWERFQDFASTTCRMGEVTWTVSRNGSTRGSSRGRPAEL